jgi:hypothetical protein
MTLCGSTDDVAPDRSTSAWSMREPPVHHGVNQGEHLASRPGTPDTSGEADLGIDEALEIEATDKSYDQQQAAIGHQVGLIEAHENPLDPSRYLRRGAPPLCWLNRDFEHHNLPARGGNFPWMSRPLRGHLIHGSRLSRSDPGLSCTNVPRKGGLAFKSESSTEQESIRARRPCQLASSPARCDPARSPSCVVSRLDAHPGALSGDRCHARR